jgi:serine/threonine protein kinase
MSLAKGTRVGPYDVDTAIGHGGMGEVYRAHDSRLNRDVALKILPDGFAHDAERLARFKREAQVLASLNHPNIAYVYGVERRAHARRDVRPAANRRHPELDGRAEEACAVV